MRVWVSEWVMKVGARGHISNGSVPARPRYVFADKEEEGVGG